MSNKYAGHTPGPWEYDGDYIWAEAIQGYVADPQTEDMRSGESVPLKAAQATIDANARLIADAPTLLADRDALAERCERMLEALVRVRAHTSYVWDAERDLLVGLLASIERITDAALRAAPKDAIAEKEGK